MYMFCIDTCVHASAVAVTGLPSLPLSPLPLLSLSLLSLSLQVATPALKRQVSKKKEEEWDKEIPNVAMGRVIKVNAPEWWLIVVGVLAAMVNGSVFPLYSILFGEVLRVFQSQPQDILEEITPWALLFLVFAIGSGIAIFFKVRGR